MQYKTPETIFHTFEGEAGMVGICFVQESEATDFASAVRFRLDKMGLARQKTRRAPPPGVPAVNRVVQSGLGAIPESTTNTAAWPARRRKGRKGGQEKPRLNKADIGAPTGFIHVKGVKASQAGFEMIDNLDNLDPRLRQLLSTSGLDEKVLSDPNKRQTIMKYVEENHVLETVEKKVDYRRSIRQAPRGPPPPPVRDHTLKSGPPPKPNRYYSAAL